MHTQIQDLYEFAQEKYNVTILGGREGLSNSAFWVYLAEDINNVSFLKAGELIITTGLFTQSGVKLYNFIHTLEMSNCSGILINVGRYLFPEDITPEIIRFCDINKFPLFIMPWEVHLVDIMQDFCRLFLYETHKEDLLGAKFQSAITQMPVPESILRTLNQYGYATSADYRIIAIRNLEDTTRITSPLNSYKLKYYLFQNDNRQVLIYNTSQKQLSLEGLIGILCYCDSIILGVSDTAHSLAEISLYYKHACFSLAAAEFWKRQCVRFDELGLFQLLFSVPDPGLLETIYRRHLGELEKYDMDHNSEYIRTLRMYLLSDCSLLETASRMHTHRNTIVYRIRQVKEILHTELDNSAVKFDLLMAFYIKEYLSI